MLTKLNRGVPLVLAMLLAASPTHGQGLETLGARAAALAAFVAVADDVSAVAWNPAGLVQGPVFNVSLDLGRLTHVPGSVPVFPGRAGRHQTTLIAIGLPPLGLSYYRIASTLLGTSSPAGTPGLDRQNEQVVLRSLVTSHLGATVLQSLGDYITVGATAKLVRGQVASGAFFVDTWHDGFERADLLDARGSTRGDLDIGAMFAAGHVRAGVLVRNLTEPAFAGEGDLEMSLARHTRVGVAWGDRWPGLARTIVAIDADTTRVPHAGGERRDVAAGAERWWRGQRLGVRGGVRVSTIGEARPVGSGGLSYAVRAGTFVDAYLSRGRHDTAWGVAARLSY